MRERIALYRWLFLMTATGIIVVVFLNYRWHSAFLPTISINAGVHGYSVAASPAGTFLAGTTSQHVDGHQKSILRLIDLKSREIVDVDVGVGDTGVVAVAPDSRTLAVGRGPHNLQIWDLTTRAIRRTFQVDGNDFLVFDPSGRYVYTAERLGNGVVNRADITTGVVETVFGPDSQIHVNRSRDLYGGQIRALVVLADGRELFLAMPLGAVVWDLVAAHERSFVSTEKFTRSIALHPDETRVAMTAGADGSLVDIRTGKEISHLRYDTGCTGSLPLEMVAFSSDGRLLAATLCRGIGVPSYLVIWRLDDRESPVLFQCADSEVVALRFVPGTNNLVSASCDGMISVWDLDSLWARRHGDEPLKAILGDWPISRPTDWVRRVNAPMTDKEADGIRTSVARSRPYGNEVWQSRQAKRLGLLHTLRGEGRPKAIKPKN